MNEKTSRYWVYILLCENGNYYTGYTTNLERRLQEHAQGSAKSKYTRSFKMVKLMRAWEFDTKSQAMSAEIYIKKLTKLEKIALIKNPIFSLLRE